MARQLIGCPTSSGGGGGGGGGGVVPIGRVREYVFGSGIAVPSSGTLYLDCVVPTSAAALRMSVDALLRRISVQVDQADASNSFNIEVLKNGASAGILALPASSLGTHAASYSTAFLAGDRLSVRIVRSAGSGRSQFRNVHVTVTLEE
jgi:hypothetical protein